MDGGHLLLGCNIGCMVNVKLSAIAVFYIVYFFSHCETYTVIRPVFKLIPSDSFSHISQNPSDLAGLA